MGLKRCHACDAVKNTGCFPKASVVCLRCTHDGKRALPTATRIEARPPAECVTSVSWWLVPAEQFAQVAHSAEVAAIIAAGRFGRMSRIVNAGISESA